MPLLGWLSAVDAHVADVATCACVVAVVATFSVVDDDANIAVGVAAVVEKVVCCCCS